MGIRLVSEDFPYNLDNNYVHILIRHFRASCLLPEYVICLPSWRKLSVTTWVVIEHLTSTPNYREFKQSQSIRGTLHAFTMHSQSTISAVLCSCTCVNHLSGVTIFGFFHGVIVPNILFPSVKFRTCTSLFQTAYGLSFCVGRLHELLCLNIILILFNLIIIISRQYLVSTATWIVYFYSYH